MEYPAPQKKLWRRFAAAILLVWGLGAPLGPALGNTQPSSDPAVLTLGEAASLLRVISLELKQYAQRNKIPARRIGSIWRFNRAALMAWLNGDWTVIASTLPPTPTDAKPALSTANPMLSRHEMKRVTATGTSIAQNQAPTSPSRKISAEGKDGTIGAAPEQRTADDVFLRSQKVLLAPGEVTIELGQFYSKSDSQQLAAVGGGVGLATIEQETLTTLLLGRVGVGAETELFASTSFRSQDNDVYVGSTKLSEGGRAEIGDINLGVRRTLLHEGPGYPDIIATIDGHIPTGASSYAIGGGLALVKSIDPAVLFANANYRHTFSRNFIDLARLEPEDSLDISMGYALALNDTLTLSTSVSGVFSSATSFDNATLRQQNSYSMQVGLTSWLAEGLYIEPSVSFGLSGPGDSVAFSVTMPYTF
ncbi:MAG: helix-turn-helix domain-containing protein [Rhodospirillaceae bacterium]|jgi:excisionase family DNA binding protein|nr:helix-turn-helix domain-containing protein [Rhodospirillaceae bacterium]MBT5459462.1 helix-turn-helix domain-containing protein [Rhodospirillaceae bacterium]